MVQEISDFFSQANAGYIFSAGLGAVLISYLGFKHVQGKHQAQEVFARVPSPESLQEFSVNDLVQTYNELSAAKFFMFAESPTSRRALDYMNSIRELVPESYHPHLKDEW